MSKETKWTPGPWRAPKDGNDTWAINGDGWGIANVFTLMRAGGTREGQANAHLIAAAPEMYDLVAKIADLNPMAGEIGPGKLRQLVSEARDVQAKARGEAP